MVAGRGLTASPAFQEIGQPLGIVRADPDDASSSPNDHALSGRNAPDPAAPRTPVDAPAVQDRRAPDLDPRMSSYRIRFLNSGNGPKRIASRSPSSPTVKCCNEYPSIAISRPDTSKMAGRTGSALVTQVTVKNRAAKANSSRNHGAFCVWW